MRRLFGARTAVGLLFSRSQLIVQGLAVRNPDDEALTKTACLPVLANRILLDMQDIGHMYSLNLESPQIFGQCQSCDKGFRNKTIQTDSTPSAFPATSPQAHDLGIMFAIVQWT